MPKSTVTQVAASKRSGQPCIPPCTESPIDIKRAAARGTPSRAIPGRPSDPDGDVVTLIGNGDVRGALSMLMHRHGVAVYRYCRRALNDATLADDVHQQVFIEAYRDLRRFTGRSTVRTWLMGIARHRVLDAAKSRHRRQACEAALGELPEVPDPQPPPFELLAKEELHNILVTHVEQLPEPARCALLLRFHHDLTFEEMARLRGESPGALHVRVARVLRRLRAAIECQQLGW